MQDQCGFTLDGKLLEAEDYVKIGSLHEWRKWEKTVKHGEWATPVWSRAQALAGSVPTPYIWDDRVDVDEVAEKILEVYNTPKETRKADGLKGREAFIGDMGLSHTNMCQTLMDGLESTFENWKPRQRFEVFKIK